MTSSDVIAALAAVNAKVVLDDDRLQLDFPADRPPPDELVKAVRERKEDLLTALPDRFEERTAILEYNHDIPRPKAEAILLVASLLVAESVPSVAARASRCRTITAPGYIRSAQSSGSPQPSP
jgi:hypothetical protein